MKIGFIGLGNMASATIGGILKKNCILQRTSSALTNQRIPFKKQEKYLEYILQRIISKWHRQQMC